MVAGTESKVAARPLLAQTVWALLRHHLRRRMVLAVVAMVVIGAGLVLNWSWLVAAGIAPILLALAPCAAMCALGVCMNRMGGKSCSGDKSAAGQDKAQRSGP